MYHRVLIPEIDQHVNRHLWRDMRADIQPETYIKTVLTFGDKPAPAMAQIAVKKTIEEKIDKFPEACEILDKDMYMDDICFSVTDIGKAALLTNQIDCILENGGFKVKGWWSNSKLNVYSTENENNELEMKNQSIVEEKVLGIIGLKERF